MKDRIVAGVAMVLAFVAAGVLRLAAKIHDWLTWRPR